LPGFRTLADEAQRIRTSVSRSIYDRICSALGESRRELIDKLLEVEAAGRRSLWHQLKIDSGAPTLTKVHSWTERLRWLRSFDLESGQLLGDIPAAKIRHFALQGSGHRKARCQRAFKMRRMWRLYRSSARLIRALRTSKTLLFGAY
jgi:hypothetical protein